MDSLFAIAFVKGMRDQERKQRVTFDLKDSLNFSFLKALTVVRFSFQEIGEPDLFRPSLNPRESSMAQISLHRSPAISQVNTVGRAGVARMVLETNEPNPVLTQEQFNAFMSSYEASIGRVPCQAFHPGNAIGNCRGNLRVTCFNCGICGHYSDACTNPPLSTYEQ